MADRDFNSPKRNSRLISRPITYDNLAEVRADPIYEKVSDDEAQRMIGEIKYVSAMFA